MVSSILSYQLATRGVRTSAALNASDSTQIIKQYIDVLLFEKLDNKRIRPTTTVIDIGNSSDQATSGRMSRACRSSLEAASTPPQTDTKVL